MQSHCNIRSQEAAFLFSLSRYKYFLAPTWANWARGEGKCRRDVRIVSPRWLLRAGTGASRVTELVTSPAERIRRGMQRHGFRPTSAPAARGVFRAAPPHAPALVGHLCSRVGPERSVPFFERRLVNLDNGAGAPLLGVGRFVTGATLRATVLVGCGGAIPDCASGTFWTQRAPVGRTSCFLEVCYKRWRVRFLDAGSARLFFAGGNTHSSKKTTRRSLEWCACVPPSSSRKLTSAEK